MGAQTLCVDRRSDDPVPPTESSVRYIWVNTVSYDFGYGDAPVIMKYGGITGVGCSTQLAGDEWTVHAILMYDGDGLRGHYTVWRKVGDEYVLLDDMRRVDAHHGQVVQQSKEPPTGLKDGRFLSCLLLLCRQ